MSIRKIGIVYLCLGIGSIGFAQEVEFSYVGLNGPQFWDKLSPDWRACREGISQSPMVLVRSTARADQSIPPAFTYGAVSLNVRNTGHSVQADITSGVPVMTVDGKIYDLSQFHFHWPSEHWVDGENYPMEMHLVHKASDGSTGVVSVLISLGAAFQELDRIWAGGLPGNKGDSKTVTNFNLAELLPTNIQAYRYSGSLTTPPCTEGVSWFVMTEAKQMSSQQIIAYQSVFGGSNFPDGTARPVRLLNARQIVLSSSLPR